ncbi:MAG: SGNH/GDSL hydrolase family protein [Bdellovibrionales bacterium]|nr:SGNH/GDSL hydrolase family protein [Bdellovibrionales bacterium]
MSLLLLEGVFRVLPFANHRAAQWTDRPSSYYIHAKSKSFQDAPFLTEKPANTYRIAVAGDSFTFAPFMQFDDSFPKRLERMLNLNGGDRRAEVLNFGVPGYSTSHEVGSIEQAISLKSDLLILQITLNDPQRKPYHPTGLTRQNEFGTYEPMGWLGKLGNYWHTLGFVLRRIHNTQTHERYRDYYFNLFQDARSWESFTNSLEKIRALSEKSHTPLVAVVFPLFGIPLDRHYPFHPLHERVHSELKKLEIPFLDLYSAFEGIPLERIQVVPHVDFHPNEIGHRIAAEQIYRWLAQEDILPENLRITQSFDLRTDIRLQDVGALPKIP